MTKMRILLFFILIPILTFGRDPQFSQFYANPLYLSPSFSGLSDGNRVNLNWRNQWPEIQGKFITYSFSYDRDFPLFNSGLGILITRDQAGSGNLATTGAELQYSYEIFLQDISFRPALSFSYYQRSIDFWKLVFNDQLRPGGNHPISIEVPPFDRIGWIDASTSLLTYSEKFWAGVTLHHLFRPNVSLYEWSDEGMSPLPIQYSFYGGLKFVKPGHLLRPLAESIQVAMHWKKQGDFQQLDIGMYWYKNPIVLGAWYRGIPGKRRSDAIVFLAGWKMEGISIGYSYDFTVSRLIGSTSGSHEISLSYTWEPIKRSQRPRMVPCPDF